MTLICSLDAAPAVAVCLAIMSSSLPPRDVRLLRRVLARELDTISEYEEMAEQAEEEVVRAFFRHLADEEKEHVAEAMALIHERDPVQAREAQKEFSADHFLSGEEPAGAEPADVAPADAAPENDAAPAPAGSGDNLYTPHFTVGSLKGRRD